MENKNFDWSEVEISILGKTVKPNSIQYVQGMISNKFEGNITIIDEVNSLSDVKVKKLSNFQRKKEWKKFCKIFNTK